MRSRNIFSSLGATRKHRSNIRRSRTQKPNRTAEIFSTKQPVSGYQRIPSSATSARPMHLIPVADSAQHLRPASSSVRTDSRLPHHRKLLNMMRSLPGRIVRFIRAIPSAIRRFPHNFRTSKAFRLKAAATAVIFLLASYMPFYHAWDAATSYELSSPLRSLLGNPATGYDTKLSYDPDTKAFVFNQQALATMSGDPIAQLQSKVGGSGEDDTPLYGASIGKHSRDGLQFYDTQLEAGFHLIPQFHTRQGKQDGGHVLFPLTDHSDAYLAYTVKRNGIKEDILLSHAPEADSLSFAYTLDLGDSLEAKLLDDGSLGVYSADPSLFGQITFGTTADEEKIMQARKNGAKTHLAFIIPRPIVYEAAAQGTKESTAAASFTYHQSSSTLTVTATKLHQASYPLSIDPSVTVTSSQDFAEGNNEGNMSYEADMIRRAPPSGGTLGEGSYASSLVEARKSHGSAIYNNHIYVLGGIDDTNFWRLSSVEYAAINSDGTLGSWQLTESLPIDTRSLAAVAYNGYLYALGGETSGGDASEVYYAPINPNGSIGDWVATSSMQHVKRQHTAVAYNGYIYAIGGVNGSGFISHVEYAVINADGSLGSWQSVQSIPVARAAHSSVAYNGKLYVLGGYIAGNNATNNVYYASINTNGTLGSWQSTTAFTTARAGHSSVFQSGHIYVIGGETSTGGGTRSDTQYAPINADGTIGAWSSTGNGSGQTPIQPHASGSMTANAGGWTVNGGYSFTPQVNGQVTALWARCDTGSFTVTLYRASDSAVLASTSVNVSGDWTSASITPVNVSAGTTYIVASTNASRYCSLTIPTVPIVQGDITINNAIFSFSGVPTIPNGSNMQGLADITFIPDGAGGGAAYLDNARSGHSTVAHNNFIYTIGGGPTAVGNNGALDSVEYAPINPPGEGGLAQSWQSSTSFTTSRSGHTTVAYGNYMYVIGGNTNTTRYAPINADGTLGTWGTTSNLPDSRQFHGSVAYNGCLYVIGGSTGSSRADVLRATFNTNGTISAYTTSGTTSLNTPRHYFGTVVYNGYIYVIGGNSTSAGGQDTVERAQLNSDCTMGAWTSTGTHNLPTVRMVHTAEVINDRVYVIGGADTGNRLDSVLSAPINSDGTLGEWEDTGSSLPIARERHASAVYNGCIYVTGGLTANGIEDTTIYACVDENGDLGEWQSTNAFTGVRRDHTSAVYNGTLYVLGGFNGSSTLNTTLYAKVNSNTSGAISSWANLNSFTTGRTQRGGVVYEGYMYVIGGWNGSALTDVRYASINANGTIGSWSSTTSLPVGSSGFAVAYNGRVYLLGGNTSSGETNEVQSAQINSNGTLGSWSTISTFTTARNDHSVVIHNDYIYVIGGDDGSAALNDIQYAQINTDGSIGAWSYATSMSTGRRGVSAVVYDGYMFISGGTNGVSTYNDVQSAPINSNGSIGSWTTVSYFHGARWNHNLLATGGYLYVIGGNGSEGTTVLYASILPDGKVDSHWEHASPLSSNRERAKAVVYDDNVYVIGGWNGSSFTNTVSHSKLSSLVPAKAHYSKLLDLGSARELSGLSFNGSGNGNYTIQYKLACSSTFGSSTIIPNARPGTNYPLSEGARYVWVRITIDDSQAITYPDTGGSTINSITLNYEASHPSPDVRLRHGTYFENGIKMPMDTNPEISSGGGCG